MAAIIRDYQETGRKVEDLIADLKDDVEQLERLGDGDEYKTVLNTMLFDLYDRIDDLSQAYTKLWNEVVLAHIPMIKNN